MYSDVEIKLSKEHLEEIVSSLEQPFCLIGGWAVYFTVNENFVAANKMNKSEYFGSKDIDLGFPINKDWNEEEIKKSNLCKAVKKLELMGFEKVSWNLRRYYCVSKNCFVTTEEQKTIPLYDLTMLQVDLLVEREPVKVNKALKTSFFEEELLSEVFENSKKVRTKINNIYVDIPAPEILIATKLKSLPNREKEHKRLKDLYDLYALIQYSNTPTEELISKTKKLITKETINKAIKSVKFEDTQQIEQELGTPKEVQAKINKQLISE